jgi:hypothetical protein
MAGAPDKAEALHTVSRGSRDKQPRAFGEGRGVPVVGEDDLLIDVCTPDRLKRYLTASNAEVKRRSDGSVRVVRLRADGDDRGHLGECHGRSTVTTQRVRNEWGRLVGSNVNLEHKQTCAAWGISVGQNAGSDAAGKASNC